MHIHHTPHNTNCLSCARYLTRRPPTRSHTPSRTTSIHNIHLPPTFHPPQITASNTLILFIYQYLNSRLLPPLPTSTTTNPHFVLKRGQGPTQINQTPHLKKSSSTNLLRNSTSSIPPPYLPSSQSSPSPPISLSFSPIPKSPSSLIFSSAILFVL